jgi:hypothetical protein
MTCLYFDIFFFYVFLIIFRNALESTSDIYTPINKDIFISFRWKGENISTTEVSNVLTDIDFVVDACVYGVPIPGEQLIVLFL